MRRTAELDASTLWFVLLAAPMLIIPDMQTGLAHLLSLLIDVVLCSLYGGGWSNAGRQYGFSLAMVRGVLVCALIPR
jgi:hypothetical protein